MTEERQLGIRFRQQEMAVDLGIRALAATDLPTLFKESAITAAAGLDADSASIFRVTDDKRALRLVASAGAESSRTDRYSISLDARVPLTLVIRESSPLIVDDLSSDPRFADSSVLWSPETSSVIAVPIPSRDGPAGVLSIASKTAGRFHQDDLSFAQAIVNILALSIERHRALRQLRGSEEHYRNLIENASDVIAVVTADGRIRFASPAIRRVFGRTPEDVVGHEIDEFVHPEDRGRARAHLIGARTSSGAPETEEIRMLHQDGSYRVVEAVGSSFADSSGRVVFVVNIRDVTDRFNAEEKLRQSEEKYREIVNSSPIGFYQVTRAGRLITANSAAAIMLGFDSPEELLTSRTASENWFSPDERQTEIDRLEREGAVHDLEVRLTRKDGSPIWVSINSRVIRGGGGEPILFEGFVTDVTERRLARQAQENVRLAIERAASEWQETFDSIEAPILILDEKDLVLRANLAVTRLTGKPFAEIIGTRLDALGTGRFWSWVAVYLAEIRTGSCQGSRQIEDPDTGHTWMLAASSLAVTEISPRLVLLARDITTLVELQGSLRRSETTTAMGAIVAGIAHEIRNPLFAISATLDAFEARFGPREEYQRYVSAFREQLTRMNKLMGDLLDYGRPLKLELEDVDPAAAIRGAIDKSAALAAEHEIQIRFDAPPLPTVVADSPKLTQVFTNLIENAIQHLPPRGEVRVAPEIAVRGDANWLRVRVEDNGPGIHSEDLSRIFHPFFSRRQGATGLGLSIARRIVDEHGGTMEAANRDSGGAVFTVLMPLRPHPVALALAAPVGQNPDGRA